MACIIRKKNAPGRGQGRFRYMVKWRDGCKQKSQTFLDRLDADEFKLKLEKGEPVQSRNKYTFKELADRFLEKGSSKLSGNTKAFYSSLIRTHLEPLWGDKKASEIVKADIEDLRTDLESKLSPSTVRGVLICLQRVLGYGEGHGWITSNVARGVDKPGLEPSRRRALEPGEVNALLDATDPKYKMLFYLALKTGARQAELLGLEWSAIENGYIHIRQQFTDGRITERLKSKRSNRFIPIDAETEKQLRRWRLRSPNSVYVFPNEKGNPQNPSNIRNRGFRPAMLKAKIRDPEQITFHSLRHTYGSHSISKGLPLADVSKYMGHSSISVTGDCYHHLMQESDDRARVASMDLPDVVVA